MPSATKQEKFFDVRFRRARPICQGFLLAFTFKSHVTLPQMPKDPSLLVTRYPQQCFKRTKSNHPAQCPCGTHRKIAHNKAAHFAGTQNRLATPATQQGPAPCCSTSSHVLLNGMRRNQVDVLNAVVLPHKHLKLREAPGQQHACLGVHLRFHGHWEPVSHVTRSRAARLDSTPAVWQGRREPRTACQSHPTCRSRRGGSLVALHPSPSGTWCLRAGGTPLARTSLARATCH